MNEGKTEKKYDHSKIEKKWASRYEGVDIYHGVDLSTDREKFYMLTEFPYPSGSGLHVGHAFSMTGADVYARFQRMKGKNVMFPMGWDAFGLPTENYAIKTGRDPHEITKEATESFKFQMKKLGFSFDWDREVNTTLPDYYKWTQWIFVKLFEKGLAYKQEMPINWCPKDKIGLANEEVIDGKCERCGTETERRTISQWVVKITDYAERLINGLKDTDFIEKVKAAQINWIGKKEGVKIRFKVKGESIKELEVFTTRPDTLEGVTFMVVAPEHEIVNHIDNEKVRQYVDEAKKKSDLEREEKTKDKTGVFSGLYAVNPFTKKEVPIWIADYVLASYGTGAIMAVPSHDERDKEFAEKFGLPINIEYQPDEKMADWVVKNGVGERKTNYHLRDWIFSRQHYWGEPVPMIYCKKDGWVGVPEDQLPVRLPEVEKYQPTDTGESPLANIKEFVEVICPKCGGEARRETDTMPNWAGSDWYFLRYCDPRNNESLASQEKMDYWLPVDVYVGGDEHNTLHLLYSRFIYQFLWDIGAVPKKYPEPYKKRLSHGVVLGPDGNRMSKSKGNVIVPDEVVDKYGADVLRTYMMFMGPFDATMAWNERSLVGVKRFIEKIHDLILVKAGKYSITDVEGKRLINKLIKAAQEDLAEFKFNTVVARLMETVNGLGRSEVEINNIDLQSLVKVLSPFAPFVAEELWEMLGCKFSVHAQAWPKAEEVIEEMVTVVVQVNGKMRGLVGGQRAAGSNQQSIEELVFADEKLKKWVEGRKYKIVFVPGRLINFVIDEAASL